MHFENWAESNQITLFGMRGPALQFRMWVIQEIYLHFQLGLRGLAIQIENAIIYLKSSVSEHEKAKRNIMTNCSEV